MVIFSMQIYIGPVSMCIYIIIIIVIFAQKIESIDTCHQLVYDVRQLTLKPTYLVNHIETRDTVINWLLVKLNNIQNDSYHHL